MGIRFIIKKQTLLQIYHKKSAVTKGYPLKHSQISVGYVFSIHTWVIVGESDGIPIAWTPGGAGAAGDDAFGADGGGEATATAGAGGGGAVALGGGEDPPPAGL